MSSNLVNAVTRRRIATGLAGVVLSLVFVTSNQAAPVGLPQTIDGGEGSKWFITNEGGVGTDLTGQEYCNFSPGLTVEDAHIGPVENGRFAFDNGATIWVNGSMFSATTTAVSTVDREGRRIRTISKPMGGVNVNAEYYVAQHTATLRTLANFQNPSNSTVTVTVSFRTNVESDVTPFIAPDSEGSVTPTSNGDGAFTRDDRWVITGNPNNVTDTAVVSHVLWGPDDPVAPPTEVRQFVYACPPNNAPLQGSGPNQGIAADYQVIVPPRATRSLLFFNQLNGAFDQASRETVEAYDNNETLGADRLSGLGPTELLQIVNWKFSFNKFFVTGPGQGMGPLVRVFAVNPAGTIAAPLTQFNAYNTGHMGGVTVATGDVDGDGIPEIVTAPGPGGGPHVRVWKLDPVSFTVNPTPLAEFNAYDGGFTGGVFVAAGDVNGDGKAEVITGAGPGGRPHVRIFSIDPAVADRFKRHQARGSFYSYRDGFTGGARVAAGNVVGDKSFEIITGAGPGSTGSSGHVRVFSFIADPASTTGGGYISEVLIGNRAPGVDAWDGFFPYGSSYTGGVFVGTGNFFGGDHDEIITGAGQGHKPTVNVYGLSGGASVSTLRSFFAYDPGFLGGVSVASSDVDDDLATELITGPGPNGHPHVRTFSLGTGVTSHLPLFYAYSETFRGGVWVSGYRSATPATP